MFYLDRRGNAATATACTAAKYDSSSTEEENFGWWLNDREIAISQHIEDHRSSGSSTSIPSYDDSEDSNNHIFAQKLSIHQPKQENKMMCEKIELTTFTKNDLDVDLIKRDATKMDISLTSVNSDEYDIRNETKFEPVCYTPERLIRCREYRILTPPPRYVTFSQTEFTPIDESFRERFSSLIDSGRIGTTQLKAILNLPNTHVQTYSVSSPSPIVANEKRVDYGFTASTRLSVDSLTEQNHHIRSTETICSSRSSYDRLNSTWNDCNGQSTHQYSLEDTSGIQSNDWSLETQSDTQNMPMYLCDELAIASKNYTVNYANNRRTAINEVAHILEGLQRDPEKATILLEEDRFYECKSSHDQLTRLALTIETDTEVPATLDNSNNWLRQLHDKIERLQFVNKEIHKDICSLRTDFQRDERKIRDMSNETRKLQEEVRDLRYLDDILILLQGELERISKRNWPFILGHSEPHGEINLII